MSSKITHVGFADESHWNEGRFRSLGVVTLPLNCLEALSSEARYLLDESQVQEFKWKKLKGAKDRFAADKLCGFTVDKAFAGQLRTDVLVWDIEDSRHRVAKRDDTANLGRMYYHLLHNVVGERWPDNAVWRLHPDEHTGMDWETLSQCLENVSTTSEEDRSLFASSRYSFKVHQTFRLGEFLPAKSCDHPLLQLADLFAGIAVFSRHKYDEYEKWLRESGPQMLMFDDGDASSDPSRSSLERFQVLRDFDNLCKKNKMGVSVKKQRGLWTPNPANPINFWCYRAQHPADKAPRWGIQ